MQLQKCRSKPYGILKKEETIEVGKKANLLFLNANPAENVRI